MKFKRIYSVILSAIVTLLCLSVPSVFAANPQSEEKSDLTLMKELGMFPEGLQSGNALTRIELANIYFRIMMNSLADQDYVDYEFQFDDIESDEYAANFVALSGIMNGVDTRIFNPSGTISYQQLITTLIRFMGYAPLAETYGGYPEGYVKCGSRLGFEKYGAGDNSIVTTDIAAALFRTALDTNVAESDIYNEYNINDKDGKNYAEKYLNIHKTEGVVDSTYISSIIGIGMTGDYFKIKIDGVDFELNQNTYELNELIGYRVKAYYKEENDVCTILSYETTKTDVTVVDANDVDKVSLLEGKVYYYNENRSRKSININKAYVIYNGKLCESYDENIINPFSNSFADGTLKFVDNNDDGIVDLVFVDTYRSYVVSKVVNGKIYNKYHANEIFDISKIDDGDIPVKNVIGDNIELSAIEEGDIISVFKSVEGEITKIIVSIDSYIGELQSVSTDGAKPQLQVDGIWYDCANSLSADGNKEYAKIKPGQKVNVYFNFEKKISDIEVSDYVATKIGYLINAAQEDYLEDYYIVKLLTTKGTILTTHFAEKVTVNGKLQPAHILYNMLGTASNGVKRQPIKYKYDDKKDVITYVELVDETIDETQDGFYRYQNVDPSAYTYFRSGPGSFGGQLLISPATVVFLVADEESRYNDDNYNTTDSSYFVDGSQTSRSTPMAYGSKAYNPIAEILVIESSSSNFYELNDVMIVEKCVEALQDDEVVYSIMGYVSGRNVTYNAKPETFKDNVPKCGDIIKIALDQKRMIARAELVFDASEQRFGEAYPVNPTDTNYYTLDRFIYGDVIYSNDTAFTISAEDSVTGAVKKESYPISGITVYECTEINEGYNVLKQSSADAMNDLYNNNVSSNVILYSRNGNPNFMIIFND